MLSTPSFPRRKPEELGIATSGLLRFLDAIKPDKSNLHSFMLLRHGQVAAEAWWKPFAPERKHMLFSLSKSFTSTAVGLAVSEGLLSVGDRVADFFPEALPEEPSDNLLRMTVGDLLCMGTGHAEDSMNKVTAAPDGDWVKAFLAFPVEHEPGTRFVYDSGASYMLSAIVQKVSGLTLLDYLKPRLFEPLGFVEPVWQACPRGRSAGGWGLKLVTEDIAKFGQLYLQRGQWNGRQLVPQQWVQDATSVKINNGNDQESDWSQGYGYQFWKCRHGGYRGDGAYGQFCIVLPGQDAVIAITSASKEMGHVMDAVWDHLLPAMKEEPLPADPEAWTEWENRKAKLEYPAPGSGTAGHIGAEVSGITYEAEGQPNLLQRFRFEFGQQEGVWTLENSSGVFRFPFGIGSWKASISPVMGHEEPVLAAAGWTERNTVELRLLFPETPFLQKIICTFNGTNAVLKLEGGIKNVPVPDTEFNCKKL